ncbi:hypothetical protein CLOM_g21380 [Closterium sp. NIES-68]|nr:hypothetical protein CLOM_g21380 [Closterium sp. NIES-68]
MHLLADSRWSYILSRPAENKVIAQVDGQIVAADLEAGNKYQHWRTIRCGNGYHVIQNRKTKNVLDHWGSQRIAAENRNWEDPHHQWQIVHTGDGFVAFKNRSSGMVLDFYAFTSIEAFNDDVGHENHQWRVVRADQVAGAKKSSGSSGEEESPGVKVKKIKCDERYLL